MSVDLISTSGVTSPGYTYDPGTGELTIAGLGLTGPKSYGQYNFEMLPSNDRFIIYIIECCQEIDFDYIVVNDATSNVGSYFSGQRILILDELVADIIPTEFYSSEVYFGADAKITIADDVEFFSDGSLFTNYCDYRWDGIFASDDNNLIEFLESDLVFSARGLYTTNNVKIKAEYSTFSQNLIGVAKIYNTSQGSYYGNSNLCLRTNEFSTVLNYVWVLGNQVANLNFAPGSPLEQELDDLYTTYGYGSWAHSNFSHVVLIESDYVQVGKALDQDNYFHGYDGAAVFSIESQAVIENNTFDSIIAVQSKNSELVIGGTTQSHGNLWSHSTSDIQTSHQIVTNNKLQNESLLSIYTPDKYYTGTAAGTQIEENEFISSNAYNYQSTTSVKKVFVNDNIFKNGFLQIVNINSNGINEGLIITNNEFASNIDNNTKTIYDVWIDNCYEARIANNVFNLLTSPPNTPTYYANGIYLNAVQDGQIKNNEFYQRTYNIYGTGNCSGTLFSCNLFEDHVVGMYFNNATISTQGSSTAGVDNVWQDQTLSEARIKVNSTTFDYYFTSGTGKDPSAGSFGILATLGNVNPYSASSSISDCGVLNKTESDTENEESLGLISFYPNPTHSHLTIDIKDPSILSSHLNIIDAQGQIVFEADLKSSLSLLNLDLPTGHYVGRIVGTRKSAVFKFVIQ